jgi:putative DNA primase/helicase
MIVQGLTVMVGEPAIASTTINLLGDKFTAMGFVGKSFVVLPEIETDKQTPIASSLTFLKTVMGNGSVAVQDKFIKGDPSGVLTCRFIFTPNAEPNFQDPSGAIVRRLLILPTGMPPKQPDPDLYSKIAKEGPGIFLWAMVGLRRLRKRGDFVQPDVGKEIQHELKRQSRAFAFAEDAAVVGEGQSCDKATLYEAWCDWCPSQGMIKAPELSVFSKQLRAAIPGFKIVREQSHGASRHIFRGIRPRLQAMDAGDGPAPVMHVGAASQMLDSHTDLTLYGKQVAYTRGGPVAAAGAPLPPFPD